MGDPFYFLVLIGTIVLPILVSILMMQTLLVDNQIVPEAANTKAEIRLME